MMRSAVDIAGADVFYETARIFERHTSHDMVPSPSLLRRLRDVHGALTSLWDGKKQQFAVCVRILKGAGPSEHGKPYPLFWYPHWWTDDMVVEEVRRRDLRGRTREVAARMTREVEASIRDAAKHEAADFDHYALRLLQTDDAWTGRQLLADIEKEVRRNDHSGSA